MKNLVENNKLIAEFLGFIEDKSFTVRLADGVSTSHYYYKDDVVCLPETMQFSYSWDWLMQVVEKIHSLQYYGVIINPNGTYIKDEDDKLICMTFKNEEVNGEIISSSNIEATYYCCVEFIQWYNQKTKSLL